MNQLIDIYNRIRNIPYKIIDVEYSLTNSYNLINSNAASCTPKHVVLADMYKAHGIESRFCVHEFRWTDFSINFNNKIIRLLNQNPIDFHTNLEIKIDTHWIIVDATWDDALINAGLPGTKKWDGKISTINGVKSLKEYKLNSLEERDAFIKAKKSKMRIHSSIETELITELNNYFDKLRLQYHNL
jgi:hypothetical protein